MMTFDNLVFYAKGSSGSSGGGGGTNAGSQSTTKKDVGKSIAEGRINSASNISSSETYTLFRVSGENNEKELMYKDKSGRDIRDDIAYEKLTFNRKEKVWVSKKGFKYVIRKK